MSGLQIPLEESDIVLSNNTLQKIQAVTFGDKKS